MRAHPSFGNPLEIPAADTCGLPAGYGKENDLSGPGDRISGTPFGVIPPTEASWTVMYPALNDMASKSPVKCGMGLAMLARDKEMAQATLTGTPVSAIASALIAVYHLRSSLRMFNPTAAKLAAHAFTEGAPRMFRGEAFEEYQSTPQVQRLAEDIGILPFMPASYQRAGDIDMTIAGFVRLFRTACDDPMNDFGGVYSMCSWDGSDWIVSIGGHPVLRSLLTLNLLTVVMEFVRVDFTKKQRERFQRKGPALFRQAWNQVDPEILIPKLNAALAK